MRQYLPIYLMVLLGGGLVGAVVLLAGSSIAVVEPPPEDPSADILYLPDDAQPGLDLERARADGARIAPSAESLQADTSDAIGVVFDASQLGNLSRPWLASQIAQGRVIVGINVTMTDLEDAAGLHDLGPTGGFRHDWRGQPFYSVTYRSPSGSSPSYGGRGSDQLSSPEILFFLMRRYARQVRGLPDPAQMGPLPPPSPHP